MSSKLGLRHTAVQAGAREEEGQLIEWSTAPSWPVCDGESARFG